MEQQAIEVSPRYDDQAHTSTILKIITELAPQPSGEPNMQARLVEELGYHSLALLELAFALEDEFSLKPLDESAARAIHTVADVVEYVLVDLRARATVN
jgi:acyl carrier protein